LGLGDIKPKLQFGLAPQYARLRRELPYITLPAKPLAFSVNGRTFGYEVPVKQAFRVGSYVSIKTKNANYLGQITAQDVATRDGAQYGITTTAKSELVIARSNTESNFVDRVRIRYVQGGANSSDE